MARSSIERTGPDVAPWDLVADVDDPGPRCDPFDHAVDHADELVGVPEVGEEGDRGGP